MVKMAQFGTKNALKTSNIVKETIQNACKEGVFEP